MVRDNAGSTSQPPRRRRPSGGSSSAKNSSAGKKGSQGGSHLGLVFKLVIGALVIAVVVAVFLYVKMTAGKAPDIIPQKSEQTAKKTSIEDQRPRDEGYRYRELLEKKTVEAVPTKERQQRGEKARAEAAKSGKPEIVLERGLGQKPSGGAKGAAEAKRAEDILNGSLSGDAAKNSGDQIYTVKIERGADGTGRVRTIGMADGTESGSSDASLKGTGKNPSADSSKNAGNADKQNQRSGEKQSAAGASGTKTSWDAAQAQPDKTQQGKRANAAGAEEGANKVSQKKESAKTADASVSASGKGKDGAVSPKASDGRAAKPLNEALADTGKKSSERSDKKTADSGAKDAGSKKSDESKKKADESKESFSLQCGSFKTLEQANALVKKIGTYGQPAKAVKANVNGAIWYRVIVGPYSSKGTAQDVGAKLMNAKAVGACNAFAR